MWRVTVQGGAALHNDTIIDFHFPGNTNKVIRRLENRLTERVAHFLPGNIKRRNDIDISDGIPAQDREEQSPLVFGVLAVI